MAKPIAEFAGGGAVVHDNRFDPELSEDIIQYIETESDFRQFVKVISTDTYVINLPRKWAAGIAVEIVEGSEIPKARDVFDVLTINLRQIGTGIKMTDEEQKMMGFDNNYFATEGRRATERLLKNGRYRNSLQISPTTVLYDDPRLYNQKSKIRRGQAPSGLHKHHTVYNSARYAGSRLLPPV